jgi:hypothetical protein
MKGICFGCQKSVGELTMQVQPHQARTPIQTLVQTHVFRRL